MRWPWTFHIDPELLLGFLVSIQHKLERSSLMTELSLEHLKAAHTSLAGNVSKLLDLHQRVVLQVETLANNLAAAGNNVEIIAKVQADLEELAKNMEAEAAQVSVVVDAPAPVAPAAV